MHIFAVALDEFHETGHLAFGELHLLLAEVGKAHVGHFVDEGKIVATGTYSELYQNCGDFRNLVDLQKLDDEQGTSSADKEVNANA